MGVLVPVEGLDGAGKRTLTEAVVTALRTRGLRVATLAFPRYGVSVHADLAAEALRGGHGDVAASVNGMALLFALDRYDARDHLSKLLADNDIVLLDRYVASNAAYSAARLEQDAHGEIVSWVGELEYERFGLPVPDIQILLDVPVDVAEERARLRGAADIARALDAYEKDGGLQRRTGNVYRELAETNWRGPWWIYRSTTDKAASSAEKQMGGDDPATLAARLAELVAG